MNFLNRAIANVKRNLTKSLLLFFTFLLIGNLVIVGLSISNAAETAKTLTRKKLKAVVTFTVDYQKFYEDYDKIVDTDEQEKFLKEKQPSVTYDDVKQLLEDERVKTANALTREQFYDDGVIQPILKESGNDYDKTYKDVLEQNLSLDNMYLQPSYFAKGNMYPNMIEIEDGTYRIVEGNFYTQEDIENGNKVVLISKALAEKNNLKIGDKFTFFKMSPSDFLGSDSYYQKYNITQDEVKDELEVIGIFEHNQQIIPGSEEEKYISRQDLLDNMLLIPGTTLNNINIPLSQKMFDIDAKDELQSQNEYYQNPDNRPKEESFDNIKIYDATILLDDPLNVDKFVEDYNKDLTDYKKIDANNEEFLKLSKPLNTLNFYASFIVILVLINAIVIISLVTALTLKTRQYEIGVLLSMGTSKFKIVSQFFMELLIVTLLGFTVAVGSGSLISKSVGSTILNYQITTNQNEESLNNNVYFGLDMWNDNYNNNITLDDFIEEYNATVSPVIILEIYVLALVIVFISILIPSLMIMRFNPKRILMSIN